MNLKEQINTDFVKALKAKDERAKSALGMLKSKITEAEKAKKNMELSDEEVLKVIISSQKQRKQSIEDFKKAGREDLVKKETEELKALEPYLPQMLTEDEIRFHVKEITKSLPRENQNKFIGMTTGMMNQKFPGQIDLQFLQSIIRKEWDTV